jgi:dTDP-4-dehydrorhamnose 3,5-epimerase
VRVTRGRIFDVAVDLRPESPTYLQWTGAELSAENGRALLIGRGMAHGFLTLEPDTDVLYQIDRIFSPGHGRGARWNDPAFGIEWPAEPQVISARDAAYSDYGTS